MSATAAALAPLVDLLRTEVIAGADVLHGKRCLGGTFRQTV